MPKSPNQKIKKSKNHQIIQGGNGKAASRPARAHAQKDYVSRKNIMDGLGRRRPGPPPTGPLGRRPEALRFGTVASPAAHMLPAFREVQLGDRARFSDSQQKPYAILILAINSVGF
jgi:hypothetical protein